MADGKSIVSGWTDGKVRSFLPQSGKLLWCINSAHAPDYSHYAGVMKLCTTNDCQYVITGGVDGEVKLWCIDH